MSRSPQSRQPHAPIREWPAQPNRRGDRGRRSAGRCTRASARAPTWHPPGDGLLLDVARGGVEPPTFRFSGPGWARGWVRKGRGHAGAGCCEGGSVRRGSDGLLSALLSIGRSAGAELLSSIVCARCLASETWAARGSAAFARAKFLYAGELTVCTMVPVHSVPPGSSVCWRLRTGPSRGPKRSTATTSLPRDHRRPRMAPKGSRRDRARANRWARLQSPPANRATEARAAGQRDDEPTGSHTAQLPPPAGDVLH